MPVTTVTPDGLRHLWLDDEFLRRVVDACPLDDLFEPFDESDAWWFACAKLDAMRQYRRTNLKTTTLQWVRRIRPLELYEIRARANKGEFDQYVPFRSPV